MKVKLPFILFIHTLLLTNVVSAQDLVTETAFEVTVTNCNDKGNVCIDIPLEDLQNYSFNDNGAAYNGGVGACDFDTLINYNYNTLFGQGSQGPYMLNQWMVDGQTFSGQFADIPELVSMMNEWDSEGSWEHSEADLSILGGAASTDYSMMNITVVSNGTPALMGYNFNIIAQGVTLEFSTGEHTVTVTENGTGMTDEFTVSVACMPTAEMLEIEIYEGQSETLCFDFTELTNGEAAQVLTACNPTEEFADFGLLDGGACVEVNGVTAGAETACFIATDAEGNTDTTYVEVLVLANNTASTEFTDEIPANQEVYQLCVDLSELPGTPVSIENVCPEESGTFVSFTLDEENYCVKYAGLECDGTEQACIVVCDDNQICDTTFMTIYVDNTVCQPQPETINNTIYQGQSLMYCFNTNDLPGTLVSIENVCEGSGNVDFILDEENYCVEYEGLTVGQDNACVVVSDDLGNTDTSYFNINVISPITDTIEETLILGESETFCVSTAELPGDSYTIFNNCEDSSGENVTFVVNDVSLCIDVTALSIGIDTACIIVCDENLICDTTFYLISVEEDNSGTGNNLPPLAVDDDFSTSENSPSVMNVPGNDFIPPGSQIVVYVLPPAGGGVGPLNGQAEVNEDGTITYTPVDGFCGEDSFNYVLCNQFGCDTALVNIKVECIGIENADIFIYNGFSPNGDDVNDYFVIKGIENYPDNELTVINRWGNTVFNTETYRGNWDGTWDGKIVPDGTYFYMLKVENVGDYQGYVQIKR